MDQEEKDRHQNGDCCEADEKMWLHGSKAAVVVITTVISHLHGAR